MSEFTTCVEYKVYNDKTGDYVSIGEDRDGLDLVELFQVQDGVKGQAIILTKEHAEEVAKAMVKYLGK